MARFMSPEWFEQVAAKQAPADCGPAIDVVVTGAPVGEIAYRVVLGNDGAKIVAPGRIAASKTPPQVRFAADYETVAAIASGKLPTYDALLEGRVRVSGDAAVLLAHLELLAGLDLIPPHVRQNTTFF